jgi:predicted anti-sigma-YlaC factor YlaD
MEEQEPIAPQCGELSCSQLVELAEGYFGLRLPAEEQARFEAHLDACSACRAYLRQVCSIAHSRGNLRVGGIPPEMQAEIVRALSARRRGADRSPEEFPQIAC